MIADIIPETKTGTIPYFSYLVPDEFIAKIKIGSVVQINLGNRKLRGVVYKLGQVARNDYKLKPISSVLDDVALPPAYLQICEWISQYYICTLGEAVSLFLPPNLKRPKEVKKELSPGLKADLIKLTETQTQTLNVLKRKLIEKEPKPVLLHGVTGSGKTEIYIKLAKDVLKQKKQVILLLPEIILTPQITKRFQEVFGQEVLVIHSRLSKSERLKSYLDFFNGKVNILIGPRLALLVPSKNLGLIIVDEEQEDSYKQDQSPRYHSVDLAKYIAKSFGILCLLGTATPRIETYYDCKRGKIVLLELKERHHKLPMPPAKIVDLKEEIRSGNNSPISAVLQQELQAIISRKKQALLFLNRRGTSTFVSCRECGEVIVCPRCSIPLVYHIKNQDHYLNCHHCDFKSAIPTTCPVCHSAKIRFFGAGTEKIEQEVKALLPEANIAVIDSTNIKTKKDYEKFYKDFSEHKVSIAIGTQIIAKGLDFPGVDLVGVVSADTGLHLPHYKASEKVFQILTQVSGRSGRKNNPGQTIIQSYWPESPAIVFASQHDFQGFYSQEIKNRELFMDPPYTKIVRVISEHIKEEIAKRNISNFTYLYPKD